MSTFTSTSFVTCVMVVCCWETVRIIEKNNRKNGMRKSMHMEFVGCKNFLTAGKCVMLCCINVFIFIIVLGIVGAIKISWRLENIRQSGNM